MNQILIGDCRDIMRQLIAQGVKVQTVVTSPPYWGLRDYGIPPSIWGGDSICDHEWGPMEREKRKDILPADQTSAGRLGTNERQAHAGATGGWFCTKCGAWKGCLGLEPDYRMYIDHMVEVFSLVWELLRDDGTLWMNLGDTYINDGGAGFQGKHGDRYNRTHTQKTLLGNRVGNGLKNKDAALMPHRTAIAMQDWGWWVRSDIVWHKLNPMPESTYDRPTKAHEYVFLMAKSAQPLCWRHRDGRWTKEKPAPDLRWVHRHTREEVAVKPADVDAVDGQGRKIWREVNLWRGYDYFYDGDAIKEPASPNSHPRMKRARSAYSPPGQDEHRGILATRPNTNPPGVNPKAASFYRRPSGWDESHSSHRELIGRYGRPPKEEGRAEQGLKESARFGREAGWRVKQNESFSAAVVDLVEMRNKRSVWSLATSPYKGFHFATFPPALIEPCILAGSRPGDIVFDPFMGSGTVAEVAQRLGRFFLGCEINASYAPLQQQRLDSIRNGVLAL